MDEARDFAKKNIEVFEQLEKEHGALDAIVINAAGCGAALKEYPGWFKGEAQWEERAKAFSAKVQDISEFLAQPQYKSRLEALMSTRNEQTTPSKMNDIVREKNKVFLNSSSATSDLTGRACTPNTVHWTYDTWMLAKSTGGATVRAGGDSWFFITADYAFGHALERDTGTFVRNAGGRVLGSVRTPFPGTSDFSSFLVQAMAARPKVIGLANAGSDTINCIKQAAEFGLARRGVQLASLLMFLPDVHALGLPTTQGLICTETFYWDLNERTRAFSARVRPHIGAQNALCMNHAGGYASVVHYLKAVADMGVRAAKASGAEVVARMKAMPCDDDCFGPGRIREDGRKLHPAHLFEVKKQEESRGLFDYYKLLQTTPGEGAFRPLGEGGCPLVRS